MLASVSICVLILVVSQASFWRASSEEGGRTCSSLCTVLTRCTALAACSALALRSARGVWPASRTTPLKLVTTMCELLSRRSEEHTSELQSLMRISYAVFCLKKKKKKKV